MKKIGVVTGTRADYGLLSRTISLLQNDPRFETRVFVCGTHYSPEYGLTISEILKDEVENIVPIEMLLSTSSRAGIVKSVGLATISFADAFTNNDIDCLLVLGDRFEILAATQTAMLMDIPVAHIHGGELTEGAFDDCIRHSITKMSNVHFPATKQFAQRIKQMGEPESSIFVVGSPGIDNIFNEKRLNKADLENSLGFELNKPMALVTYHPVTKTNDASENDVTPIVEAIKDNPEISYIITYPNADGGGIKIIEKWKEVSNQKNIHIVPSLGFQRYLSLMEHVSCVIGNSSSGIIEAPSFNVGTVNIGSRQDRRPRATTVIDVQMDQFEISTAIKKCSGLNVKNNSKPIINPYGRGGAAEKIVETLANLDFQSFKVKEFIDREFVDGK